MAKRSAPLNTRQFSERVGVTPETVRRWVRSGRLTPMGRTPTGQLRFDEVQVEEALGGSGSLTPRAASIAAKLNAARVDRAFGMMRTLRDGVNRR